MPALQPETRDPIPGTRPPVIAVRDLVKTYDPNSPNPVRALQGLSFQIQPGEFVAVMGASGSGKSTLMNILGCLDRPTSGTYRLDGADVSRERRRRLASLRSRALGFVFQNFQLLPRLTALENAELPLQYRRDVSTRQRRARAEEALVKVGLADKLRRRPTELSGGQQQRIAIARALVNTPRVLLADEPTGNLDTHTGLELLALLQQLNRAGLTIVMVTHENDVAVCAMRRLILRDGRLVTDARQQPADAQAHLAALLQQPANDS